MLTHKIIELYVNTYVTPTKWVVVAFADITKKGVQNEERNH